MTNPVFNSPIFNPIMSAPYPNVLLSDKIASAFADPMVWDVEDRSAVALQGYSGGTMGTALQFGRRLDQLAAPLGRSIGIAQVSVTGAFLGGPTPHFSPSFVMGTPPNLFNVIINQINAAITAQSGNLVGFTWIQGEADAGNGAAAGSYAANLRTFRDTLRSTYPNALFVFNRVNCRNFPSLALIPQVRAAEEDVAKDTGCRMFNCDDIPLPNGAHYDAQGYYELGNRAAECAWSLQNGVSISGSGTAWRTVNVPQMGPKIGENNN